MASGTSTRNFYKSDLLKRLALKKMQRMSDQHPIRLRLGKWDEAAHGHGLKLSV